MPYPGLLRPEPICLWQTTVYLHVHRRRSDTVLSQSLWHPWVLVHTRLDWALWVSLAGVGFDSKCEFAPPIILLGLLLWPWTWGISSQLLQYLRSYWGFSDLGPGLSPHHQSSEAEPPLLTLGVVYSPLGRLMLQRELECSTNSECVANIFGYSALFSPSYLIGLVSTWTHFENIYLIQFLT